MEELKKDIKIKEYLNSYESSFNELILFDVVSNINSWNTTNLSVVNNNINIGVNNRISRLNGLINESKRLLINRLEIILDGYPIEQNELPRGKPRGIY